jgi:hypothetical protein
LRSVFDGGHIWKSVVYGGGGAHAAVDDPPPHASAIGYRYGGVGIQPLPHYGVRRPCASARGIEGSISTPSHLWGGGRPNSAPPREVSTPFHSMGVEDPPRASTKGMEGWVSTPFKEGVAPTMDDNIYFFFLL